MKPCIIQDKAIFLHIPKTGGISIETLFGIPHKGGLNKFHTYSWRIKREVPKLWNDKFTFTIVRNPWDRIVSCFFWILKNTEYVKKSSNANIELVHMFHRRFNNDFNTFLEFFKKYPGYTMRKNFHFQPQTNWLIDQTTGKKLDINFIGRFENLENDVKKICKEIDFPFTEMPHKNKSSRGNYKEYYNHKTKKIVEDIYRQEIQLLGYKF